MIKNKSENRKKLEEMWRKWSRGDSLPLTILQQILGVDCGSPSRHSQSPGYGVARRAAVFLESETNGLLVIRWDRERQCWRALESHEIPNESTIGIKSIRKKASRTGKMCCAAITELPEGSNERDQCVVNMTIANAVYSMTSRATVNKTMRMVKAGGVSAITEDQAIEMMRTRS